MVQEPSFLTLAGQEVRRLRSRSVAVTDKRSPAASNRKLERMGIVVLRSTTPCVAVSSRNKSNLLTLISMVVVPAAAIASTGITGHLRQRALEGLRIVLPLYQKKNH